ncbi:DUF488 family protein [Niabella beijingensis]|uniref:DUF488 domain-containing protein n=1 Tax=Niabella beijingensis TaxID=2872700 RepID=UPI001CBA7CB3|nr:DUF488 domain-containing protein [Niabella beijingensis]MBZ4191805.1 DUF488 domain-containing protein [Niabella beijingensis]
MHTLYTIGHSTHSMEDFIGMLASFSIRMLADIRRFPGSRKFPRFGSEVLATALKDKGIGYVHLEELGGRRAVQPHSRNDRWRNAAFRGYADYMETPSFEKGIEKLEALAVKQPTACMCSEAVWWRCHRSMVSDYLKAKGWEVLHIMAPGKATEHPYTQPARVEGDKVVYFDAGLFDR